MRLTQRWLGVFLMAIAVASPIVVAGCAEHARVRVYDPYYGDYHAWNDQMKVVFYRQWVVETHRPYHEFARCRPKSSGNIGTGATIARITTESCTHIVSSEKMKARR